MPTEVGDWNKVMNAGRKVEWKDACDPLEKKAERERRTYQVVRYRARDAAGGMDWKESRER